jgi:oligopeptide/dipeptide ABC transporter ATP-binding protein
MKSPLVRVRGLKKHYPVRRGLLRRQVGTVRAVDDLSFDILEGETLGLVGETGSGKSTTGRALLQLVRPTAGEVRFQGTELTTLGPGALRRTRRHMQMIFQDPYSSLNPRLSVGSIVGEPLEVHAVGDHAERRARVQELLALVGLHPDFRDRYPHQFSGGQRQRIGIARALATSPRFVVADEPLSALDVSVQAQIVNLLRDLKERLGLTYLLIAHDLAMVRYLSDRVAVMYLGRIVELGSADSVFGRALHPYTQALRSAIPRADPDRGARPRPLLEGEVPSAAHPPPGCHFHPRCPFATDVCVKEDPQLRDLGPAGAPHQVACHHAERFLSAAVTDPP